MHMSFVQYTLHIDIRKKQSATIDPVNDLIYWSRSFIITCTCQILAHITNSTSFNLIHISLSITSTTRNSPPQEALSGARSPPWMIVFTSITTVSVWRRGQSRVRRRVSSLERFAGSFGTSNGRTNARLRLRSRWQVENMNRTCTNTHSLPLTWTKA